MLTINGDFDVTSAKQQRVNSIQRNSSLNNGSILETASDSTLVLFFILPLTLPFASFMIFFDGSNSVFAFMVGQEEATREQISNVTNSGEVFLLLSPYECK